MALVHQQSTMNALQCEQRRTATLKTFEVTAFSGEFWKNFYSYAILGVNCAPYGCSTSRKSGLLLFKLPFPRAGDGEETKACKEIACK